MEPAPRAPCLVELSGMQLTPEMWQRTLLVGGTKPASAYIATAERWLRESSTIYLSGIGHSTVVRIAEILRLSSMALTERTTLPNQEGFEARKTVMWIAMRRSTLFEKAVAEAAEAKELGLEPVAGDEEDDS